MTTLVLNDAMAVLRARLERDLARFSLTNLVRELNASTDVQIWVWDGANNKAARRAIYPAYKERRKPADPSIYKGMMLLKQVLKHTKGITVEVPGVEADDVIAALAHKYAGSQPIEIRTRDLDLRALCALHPSVKCLVSPKEGVPDDQLRLFKTWVGDPSDNIPGVKGFGKGAWDKADKDELKQFTAHVVTNSWPLPDYSPRTFDLKFYAWVRDNRDLFKAYWDVIGFLPVHEDTLLNHMVVGSPDMTKVETLLGEYFL